LWTQRGLIAGFSQVDPDPETIQAVLAYQPNSLSATPPEPSDPRAEPQITFPPFYAPDYWIGWYFLGEVYAQQGRVGDAIAAQQKAAEIEKNTSVTLTELARDCALQGKVPEARQALRDLLARSQHFHVPPYAIATIYAALGDKDQALAQLEQAYNQHSFLLDFLKVDPELDPLRSDPRFQDLLRRMKLQ